MASRFPLTINTNTLSIEELPANVGLDLTSSNIANVPLIDFDTATNETAAPGQLTWNDGEGTLDLGLKGGNTTLNIGTQEYARVYNAEATTLNKGEVVYVFGAQGNRVSVKRAQANVEATSFGTLGFVAETIASGAEGYVIVSGALYKLNTNGLTAGNAVYLSPTVAGGYTTTKPQAPDQLVILGWIERVSTTVGSIYVKVDNGYELDELHDVVITNPILGQALVYGPANLWINGNSSYSNTAGTVVTNAQPNITSVGTLSSLSVNGNITAGNIITTLYVGNLSGTGNSNIGNLGVGVVTATGNITAPFFIGNGSQLTGIASGIQSQIANGTSNITIPVANSTILYFNTAGSNAFTMTRTSGGGTLGFVQDGGSGITLDGGRVAIGRNAVLGSTYSTAIGYNIPAIGSFAVAIGSSPKGADWSVSVGTDSGGGQDTVSLGGGAGRDAATGAIAIGRQSANSAAKANSISIGYRAGFSNIGVSAIAIGAGAGNLNQANNSIVINATGANLTASTANTFIVQPVRANIQGNITYYNSTSGEISFGVPTMPSFTIAGKPATGAIGQVISISDATPGGRLAFWDTTNSRWSYVNDNSAV